MSPSSDLICVNLILTFAYITISPPNIFCPFIHSFTHSQGSNNSDQSSGYLSGGGGGNSLPVNVAAISDPPSHYDYKYGQARLDNLNDKFLKADHQTLKKLSLASSMNDYASMSNHDQDIENYNNGHK